MTLGPGKYDDLCTTVRQQVGIIDEGGLMLHEGGVILIVIGGDKGNGFSCQADINTTLMLPDMLEQIAKQIRASGPFIPSR